MKNLKYIFSAVFLLLMAVPACAGLKAVATPSTISGTLPVTNGGTGATTPSGAMTNLNPTDQYVASGGTDTDIQTAATAIFTANAGTTKFSTVNLQGGGTYTLSNPVYIEANKVNLDCHGATLDASAITNAAAINLVNYKDDQTVWMARGGIHNCFIIGNSSTYTSNTSEGILIQGTSTVSTTLNGGVNAAVTTFTLTSGTGLPTTYPFSMKVDSEYVLVTNVSTNTATVTRAWLGTTAASHSNGATISSQHSTQPLVENTWIRFFNKNIDVGPGAWLAQLDHVMSGNGFYAFYSDLSTASSGAAGEGFNIHGGAFYNSMVNFFNKANVVKLYGTSFDYFFDDGGGGSSKSHDIDLEFGSITECHDCHMEWSYGQSSGETNNPIYITNADTEFKMFGGFMVYTGTSLPHYTQTGYSDNASQNIELNDVSTANLNRFQTATSDDALFTSATATHVSTTIGHIQVENLFPHNFSNNDVPSCVSYEPGGGNWFRGGLDDIFNELSPRITVTGAAVIADGGASSGSVTAKTGSHMVKITGAGTVNITLPVLHGPFHRVMWSFFGNGSDATGTVTVSDRLFTVHPNWNGSTSLSFTQDTRNSVSSGSPYTLPDIAVNQWDLISWKNLYSTQGQNVRLADYESIIVDTTSMSGGSYYIDTACWSQI